MVSAVCSAVGLILRKGGAFRLKEPACATWVTQHVDSML